MTSLRTECDTLISMPTPFRTRRLASGALVLVDPLGDVSFLRCSCGDFAVEETYEDFYECARHAHEVNPADEQGPEDLGCECEQDWNCPLHKSRVGTWLERRYDNEFEPWL